MVKIERLLGILLYIINRDNVTANTLAERFNVSRRTILRDIDTLTLAGVPIYSEIGSKGGYSINRDYKLNEKIIDNGSIISYISMLKEAIQHNKTVIFQYINLNSNTRIVKYNI